VALRLAGDPSVTIGAMILDGVDPPEAHEFTDGATGAEAGFSAVFAACLAELSCHSAFPDIVSQFDTIIARAATDPIRLSLPNPQGGTLTAQLDDAKLIETLFYAFYDWRRLEELPAVIAAVATGDTTPLVPLARFGLETYAGGASLGLYLSVECHDDFFFNPPEDVNRAAAAAPRFKKFALSTLPLAACPAWPAGEASPAEHTPLTRDVPVLMLVGALDPVTPPQWAEGAATHLPHAYVVKFPGAAHGVLGVQLCASRLVDRMLAEPLRRPDDDCVAALGSPRFRTALAANPPGSAARSAAAAPHQGQTEH
jgi:pimeloyl-ACP methyl ester carboxylesterase